MRLGDNGSISWGDTIHLITVILRARTLSNLTPCSIWINLILSLAFLILWSFTSNLLLHGSFTAAKRATTISTLRFFGSSFNVTQIQYILGSSENIYKAWTKQNNLPVTIERLVDDSVLYWIGPKRTDRVILYIPGMSFWLPA